MGKNFRIKIIEKKHCSRAFQCLLSKMHNISHTDFVPASKEMMHLRKFLAYNDLQKILILPGLPPYFLPLWRQDVACGPRREKPSLSAPVQKVKMALESPVLGASTSWFFLLMSFCLCLMSHHPHIHLPASGSWLSVYFSESWHSALCWLSFLEWGYLSEGTGLQASQGGHYALGWRTDE